MSNTLPVKKGIDGIPTSLIPTDPAAFVSWFTNSFLPRWAANGDTRNATAGAGISITGDIATPATVSVSTQVQSLFAQPYVLIGKPVAPAVLTDYRSLAVQVSVISLTDGGAGGTVSIGVVNNGISNTQLRQGAAASVIGNATNALANVGDIVAGSDNTTLVRTAGALSFSALPLAAVSPIANNSVIGNVSGSSAAPIALSATQLTALVNVATASLSGALPALSGTATQFLNGVGAWATPAYPTGANPSAVVGLTAVNGSSGSFMRSDGAPALDQSIAPTWTGLHTFNAGVVMGAPVSGVTLNVSSVANMFGIVVQGPASGVSKGMRVLAGLVSTDITFRLDNAGATATFMEVFGDGHGFLGPTASTGASWNSSGAYTFSTGVGVNGNSPPAQVTGFGTPVGGAVVASYNITDAGGANSNTNKCVAEILTVLKAFGLIAA